MTPSRSWLSTWRRRILGVANMFAYPLRVAHYVELVNPLWTSARLQARVVDVHDEMTGVRTLTLRPGRNWHQHRAGQHLRVGVVVDGMQFTRTYTISSPPERSDGLITITVKAFDGGRVSPHLVRSTIVGDLLPIGLPQGEFFLPDSRPVLPLFLTGGSGITPIHSMVQSLVARDRLPSTSHIHYAPNRREVILGDALAEVAATNERYQLTVVPTHEKHDGRQGSRHFNAAQLDALCPDWREREVYACGPPALLAAVTAHMTDAGLERHLHIERFRAAFAEVPDGAEGGKVSFAESEVSAAADADTPLLRVAEIAGINAPHGCRMGICHSCDTVLEDGGVRDLRNGRITAARGAVVQLCVSAAAGDCTLKR